MPRVLIPARNRAEILGAVAGPGGTSRGQDGITRPGVCWVSQRLCSGTGRGRVASAAGAPQAILMTGLALGLEKPYSVSDTCQSVWTQPDCICAASVPVMVTAHDLLDSPSPYFPPQGDTDATLTTRLSRAAARGPHQGGDRRRIRRSSARAGV